MKRLTFLLTFTFLPLFSSGLFGQSKSAFDHTHAAFTDVLAKHVKNEQVDYAGLKKNPAPLNAYVDSLAAVPESAFKSWEKNQQLAYLINTYNAVTLKLVADHYPVKSIRDIGGEKGPWKQPVVRLFGKNQTLDYLEHNLLRPQYKEPRVHFAVNCASIGCPALRAEAFQATKLDAQMDEQARLFLRDAKKNKVDAKNKTLHLSEIFNWFQADFTEKSGTVEKFIAPYLQDADRVVVQKGSFTITYTKYDWTLNKQ